MSQSQDDHTFDWVTRRKKIFVRDHFQLFLKDTKDAVERRNSQGPFVGDFPEDNPWEVSEESPEEFSVIKRRKAGLIDAHVRFQIEDGCIKITSSSPQFQTIIVRPAFKEVFGTEQVSYSAHREFEGEPTTPEEFWLRWRILEDALGDLFFDI